MNHDSLIAFLVVALWWQGGSALVPLLEKGGEWFAVLSVLGMLWLSVLGALKMQRRWG